MEESDVGHEEDEEELDPEHANDPQLPLARDALMNKYFAPGTKRIYYQRQLQVVLEREYFHWITAAAVKTLTGDNSIATEITQVGDSVVRLLWPHGHRYRSREQKVLLGLVERISTPDFATGVGRHAETLFDAALPRIGMKPVARDVKDFDGKTWVRPTTTWTASSSLMASTTGSRSRISSSTSVFTSSARNSTSVMRSA